MKAIKIILIILATLGLFVYVYFPRIDADADYWETAWWQKSLFNFCKYALPDGYTALTYLESHGKDKNLIVFKNHNTNQQIVLSQLRGFRHAPFNVIEIGNSEFKDSARTGRLHLLDDFKIVVYMPILDFLKQKDLSKIPDNLILKGLTVENKEQYDTPKAHVFYVKGAFTKIGFFKKMPFPWSFATPVFDFLWPQKGALAILNNKDANETIIVTSAVPISKEFDEKTFKTFIESISFDKEVYKPALLEGITQEPKPKVKYSF